MDKEAAASIEEGESAWPKVIVYSSSDCHWCVRVKEYLAQRGVPFTEKDVELDVAAAEAFNLAGRRQVPVTAVGSRAVVGFQQRELDALLGFDAPGSIDAGIPASVKRDNLVPGD